MLTESESKPLIVKIAETREVIKNGGFFCQACLVGKPLDDQSPDPRYCHFCYDFLRKEAEQITGRHGWIPKPKGPEEILPDAPQSPPVGQKVVAKILDNEIIPPSNGNRIMHRAKQATNHVVHNSFPGPVNSPKRGPKFRGLPDDLIIQWASKGMASRAIAMKLKRDYKIQVDHSVIVRRLQRVLL